MILHQLIGGIYNMFKTEQEAITYIEHQVNKRPLEAYHEVLKKHHIDTSFTYFIHVTGTNGKGSTVNYLRNLLNQAGYKVGTFTSPYLISYHDRFCIDGKPISGKKLLEIVNEAWDIIEGEHLSKFEIDVLITLLYFKKEKVDYAIIEVGIGGRLDKTNVVQSKLSLISNVGYDHMSLLGNTLEEIAYQKAGIIKPHTHVITTEKRPSCLKVIQEEALKVGATCELVEVPSLLQQPLTFTWKDKEMIFKDVALYQINNMLLALHAFDYLQIELPLDVIESTLKTTQWAGRFEKMTKEKQTYIDGAHNKDGIEALVQTLDSYHKDFVVIFSALKDKDYPYMIDYLQKRYLVYVTVFADERQTHLEDLKDYEHVFENFDEAYKAAKELNRPIVITGSLHFISYVRKKLI